jgi:hypothetical protein
MKSLREQLIESEDGSRNVAINEDFKPQAYMIQREFKNHFFDFKLTMCEYVNDLTEIDPETDGFEYWKTSGDERIKDENGNELRFPLMKVYPLAVGQPIKGEMYMFLDGQWRNKKSLKTTHPEIYKLVTL